MEYQVQMLHELRRHTALLEEIKELLHRPPMPTASPPGDYQKVSPRLETSEVTALKQQLQKLAEKHLSGTVDVAHGNKGESEEKELTTEELFAKVAQLPDEHFLDGNNITQEGAYGEEWIVRLNRYQRDNLLWLFTIMGWPFVEEGTHKQVFVEPFHLAHNGDWVGEIPQRLALPDKSYPDNCRLSEGDSPNETVRAISDAIEDWFAARVRREIAEDPKLFVEKYHSDGAQAPS